MIYSIQYVGYSIQYTVYNISLYICGRGKIVYCTQVDVWNRGKGIYDIQSGEQSVNEYASVNRYAGTAGAYSIHY